ncbi:MAG: hypothetical protein R2710_00095, partial [Acidimicrobiales bacterium]
IATSPPGNEELLDDVGVHGVVSDVLPNIQIAVAIEAIVWDADLDALPAAAELVIDVFERFRDVPTAVVHGYPGPINIRIGLLDWDEARVDLTWHDLSTLGVQVLDGREHFRSRDLAT